MYCLRVEDEFDAAHWLTGYPGNCAQLHGHRWRVQVEVEATKLDELGMAIDFRTLKGALRRITSILDHSCLNSDASEVHETLKGALPTAENLARGIYYAVQDLLAEAGTPDGVRVAAVTVWETPASSASYREPQSDA